MPERPIANHKEICRTLAKWIGWDYGGWCDGFYCFQTGNYRDGFIEMKLLECDLTVENMVFMVNNKLTRTEVN